MGTKAGISKFNGRYFENFRLSDDTPDLRSNAFAEDRQGNIWTVTEGGAAYYDGIKWHKVSQSPLRELAIYGDVILGNNPSENEIWQLSTDSAQVILLQDTLQLVKGGRPVVFFTHSINATFFTVSGLDQRLRLVARDTYFYIQHFVSPVGATPAGSAVKITLPNRNGWSYLSVPGSKRPFDSIQFNSPLIQPSDLNYMPDAKGISYYYSYNNNKIWYSLPGSKAARDAELPISTPSAIIRDRDGAIWFGAEDGLYQYFPTGFQSISAATAPMPWSLVEDNNRSYYIGTYGYGLKRFYQNKIESVNIPASILPCTQQELFYFGAAKDIYGNLYFPHNCGLIQKKGAIFRNLLQTQPTPFNLTLHSFYDEKRNKILAGTVAGVYVYDPVSDRLDSIRFQGSKWNICSIAQDLSGNYWFSPVWKGIVQYRPETKSLVYFNSEIGELPFPDAYCIIPDPENGIWFGSNKGLYFKDGDKQNFTQIAGHAIEGPVYNLTVVDSLLMIGDLSGLYVLNLNAWRRNRSEKVKAYNQFNGFTGIDPQLNAAILDSKGNYWVVCSNQIAFLHKSKISLTDHPSRVRIFQINRQRVPYSGKAGIILPEGENEVTVRFESIGFQQPLRAQYSWRLRGRSEAWSPWSEDDIAYFSQLPSGRYTFEVRSRHPGSVSETDVETDRYAFEVRLPLYREPHFYQYAFFAGGFALLFGFFALGAWRKARAEVHKANEVAGEREKMIKYYQVQTLQAQLNPHFIFNLLETIQQFVEQEKTADAVQQIQRLAKLLRRFMESSINSDLDKIRDGNRDISLTSEIELLTYYIELEQIQKPGMFTYAIEIANDLEPGNCFITPMIIQPFVENAIKRGLVPKPDAPRHLLLSLCRHNEDIRCRIEDNGIGRDASREMQARSVRKFKPRGVTLVQDRVALLAEMGVPIAIDISDRPGGGTVVTIDFGITTTPEI